MQTVCQGSSGPNQKLQRAGDDPELQRRYKVVRGGGEQRSRKTQTGDQVPPKRGE